MVTAARASTTGIFCSGPSTAPERVSRFTPHHTVSSMSGGSTGVSWWKVKGMSRSRAAPAGLIRAARSAPKFFTCTSPQWYT